MRLVVAKGVAKGGVWMEEPEAAAAIVAGTHVPAAEDEYSIVPPEGGKPFPVEPGKLVSYLQAGWRFADPNEIRDAAYADVPATAAALGSLDLLSGGLVHPAAQVMDELGFTQEAGPIVEAVRTQNPKMHAVGQLAAFVAALPMAEVNAMRAGPGMQAARGAMATAMAFPRGAAAAGEVASGAAGRLAGKLGAGALATDVAKFGARGAAEGAYYGYAQGMSEADMGDPADVAQHLIASTGTGVLLGGGLGAAMPIAGAALQKGARGLGAATANIWESATGVVGKPGLPAALERGLVAMQKRFHPEHAGMIDELANKTVRDELANPDLAAHFAKNMAAEVNESEPALQDAIKEMWSGKYKNAARLIAAPNEADSVNAAGIAVAKLEELSERIGLTRMAQVADQNGNLVWQRVGLSGKELDQRIYDFGRAEAEAEKLRRIGRAVRRQVNGPQANAATAFEALNQARRDVDELIPWSKIKAGVSFDRVERNFHTELIKLRADFAAQLERPDLWGQRVADQQARLNVLYSRHKQGESLFNQALMLRTAPGKYVSDPKKILLLLKDPKGMNLRQSIAYDAAMADYRDAAGILREFYGASKAASRLETATARVERLFGEVDKKLGLQQQAQDWMKGAQEGVLSRNIAARQIGRLGPLLVGAQVGGIPGALGAVAVREAIGAVLNPAEFWLDLAKLNRLRMSAQTHIKNKAQAIVQVGTPKRRIWAGLRRALTPTALALIEAKPAARQLALAAKVKQYQDESQNPDGVRERVAASFGGAENVAPGVLNAVSMQLLRVATYMASVAPMPGETTMFGPVPTLSDAEVQKFARQMIVAEDPLSVLDKMQEGRLATDEARALRAMYPDLYRGIQTSIMEYIQTAGPEAVPFAKRIQVGILFDTPTDPSLLPRNVVAFQRNVAAMPMLGVPEKAKGPAPKAAPTPELDAMRTNMRKVSVGQVQSLVKSHQSVADRLESR